MKAIKTLKRLQSTIVDLLEVNRHRQADTDLSISSRAVRDIIQALNVVIDDCEWITGRQPTLEECRKENFVFLVTIKDSQSVYSVVAERWTNRDDGKPDIWGTFHGFEYESENVIAWKPLPRPFKGKYKCVGKAK